MKHWYDPKAKPNCGLPATRRYYANALSTDGRVIRISFNGAQYREFRSIAMDHEMHRIIASTPLLTLIKFWLHSLLWRPK